MWFFALKIALQQNSRDALPGKFDIYDRKVYPTDTQ
jgi:hypothetical protein